MALLTCRKCARANPPEAVYCYHDGVVLDGQGRAGGPVSVATQPFPSPFVFPSGRTCRNFDELALACQDQWSQARDLLQRGFFQNFLAGIGRPDLAAAAKEAANFPDLNRGLDQFLERLPNQVLLPPQLRVEPAEVNLGVVPASTDRKLTVTLQNRGMRLLHGTISVGDCPWLSLGDGDGKPQKVFQLTGEVTIPVQIRGQRLRAGVRKQEAQILVESSGGTLSVPIRLEVPVKPFPEGVLAGALTPRQIAEKAKAHPQEAALLFEKGIVTQWYKNNGWTYPVKVPAAYGLGAVQQFFEALGLTPPPRVELSQFAVALQGGAGDQLAHTLEVRSPEKRPVWAYASSDQPWLEVGRARLTGNNAVIPLAVPRVPDRPGQTLRATVTVTANGQQRFLVPVTLTVGASFSFETAVNQETTVPGVAAPPPLPEPVAVPAGRDEVVLSSRRRSHQGIGWGHFIPALLLLAVLLGGVVYDFAKRDDQQQPGRKVGLGWKVGDLKDGERRLDVQLHTNMRFGIHMLKEPDPKNKLKFKRLTYDELGRSNNTCVKIDDYEYLFGNRPGRWLTQRSPIKRADLRDPIGWQSVMEFPNERVVVTQTVELVPGEQTRVLDTLLIRYTIENQSEIAHHVGLRVMLDTFIGANDGVPFTIPGYPGLLETRKDFDEKDIPDYIQALERPDLKDPGTVAHMGLKGFAIPGMDLEPIEKLRICRWPGNSEVRWSWEPTDMNQPADERKDSCVALYWAERKMAPREKREMAFTYGLNALSGGGNLSLTVGGSFKPGGEFTVTAYVKDPEEGQTVKLKLPAGLSLVRGQQAEQTLQRSGNYTQASWRVQAEKVGTYTLEVASGRLTERYEVPIRNKSFFD
jgi:hypothetical protein